MAKTVIVKIPNVSEEVRIGYSFNYMIKVMAETETADVVQWDFADVTFLHPFFLAPLAIYKNTSGKNIECINMSLRIQSYLNCICFDRMLHFGHDRFEQGHIRLHYKVRTHEAGKYQSEQKLVVELPN